MKGKNKFRRGTNVVATCRCCGKLTHSSIDGYLDVRMCRVCLESSGQENSHSDNGHDAPVQGCPTCAGVSCMHEITEEG